MESRRYHDDELVVNYHDACIYGRDLRLLEDDRAWLNDSCLHYHFTRLQQQQENQAFVLIDPAVVTFLMMIVQGEEEDSLEDLRKTLHPTTRTAVFLPINDQHGHSNQWHIPGRGAHWSLLVMLDDGFYYHFDSIRGNNSNAARAVAKQWHQFIVQKGKSSAEIPIHFVECQAPQQVNGHDCGLHLLATVEALLKLYQENGTLSPMSQQAMEDGVRQYIHQNLEGLRRRIAKDVRQQVILQHGIEN